MGNENKNAEPDVLCVAVTDEREISVEIQFAQKVNFATTISPCPSSSNIFYRDILLHLSRLKITSSNIFSPQTAFNTPHTDKPDCDSATATASHNSDRLEFFQTRIPLDCLL